MIYLNHDFFQYKYPPLRQFRIADLSNSATTSIGVKYKYIKSFSYFQLFLIPEPFRLFFFYSRPLCERVEFQKLFINKWLNLKKYYFLEKFGYLILIVYYLNKKRLSEKVCRLGILAQQKLKNKKT